MNEENQQTSPSPTVIQPVFQPSGPENQVFTPKRRSKKPFIVLAMLTLVFAIIGSGVAYALLFYIPNQPENVFKKAVSNMVQGGNYTVKGRMDQGDVNTADFNYDIRTDGNNVSARIDATTTIMSPTMEILRSGGKTYVKASNWLDKAGLATRYLNYGDKGLQEYLSEFAENSGIFENQGEWIEIDDWVFEGGASSDQPAPSSFEEAGVNIVSFSEIEDIEGKQIRRYKVSITREGFARLLGVLDNSSVLKGAFDQYGETSGFPESINADLEIDVNSKTIQKILYDGRPFRDATLSLELVSASNTFEVPTNAELASSALKPGIVSRYIFNSALQSGDTSSDKERVADLKGIKMAMEMHNIMYGEYPGRMDIAVNSENYLRDRMPGIDPEVFKDPNGRFIGRNGSQYAYVGYAADDSEMCGPLNGAICEKYFVATTLDNGQEYKLTSN